MEQERLILAISSRALFDLNDSHKIFEQQGVEAYRKYQIAHERETLPKGYAFNFVQKLLNLNQMLTKYKVEVILISRNSSDTGLRAFNSIEHYGLNIERAAFTSGISPIKYLIPFGCHLFLSTNISDVREALQAGCASAVLLANKSNQNNDKLKIAFDGDAVLFSDESERIYKKDGLEAFKKHEKQAANQELSGGPFRPFLIMLHKLQQEFNDKDCPIRTALVTARGAPAHERVILTLRNWNIRLDETFFLAGFEKTAILDAFGADIFFDDQLKHCTKASVKVTSGHVPHGIRNQ